MPSGRRKNAGVHFIIPRLRACERAVAGGDGRSVGSSPTPWRIPHEWSRKPNPSSPRQLVLLPVHGDGAGGPPALVVADHVDVDPVRLRVAHEVALLEERRRDAAQHEVERDRLDVVRFEPDAHRAERIDDLVGDRPDRGLLGRRPQLPAAAHRPLLPPPRDAAEAVDHAPVGVLAEAEVGLDRAVGLRDRHPDLLGPRVVGVGDRRERVDDLVVQSLVGALQRADVTDAHGAGRYAFIGRGDPGARRRPTSAAADLALRCREGSPARARGVR